MSRPLPLLFILLLSLWIPSCGTVQDFSSLVDSSPATGSHIRRSALDRLSPSVRADFERLTGSHLRDLITAHKAIETGPAHFKRRLVVAALKQPWDDLGELERQGLLLAELAKGGSVNLPALLDELESGMDRTSIFYKPVPLPISPSRKDLLAFLVGSLEQASLYRDNSMKNLTEEERDFLFLHAGTMVEQFIPQISTLPDQVKT
jgi:hypothetical protein